MKPLEFDATVGACDGFAGSSFVEEMVIEDDLLPDLETVRIDIFIAELGNVKYCMFCSYVKT